MTSQRAATKFIAFRFDRQVSFASRADARKFVLARGDQSQLWSMVEVSSSFKGSTDDLYAMQEAA